MGDLEEHLVVNDDNADRKPCGKLNMSSSCLSSYIVFIFTYWPAERILKIFSSQDQSIKSCEGKPGQIYQWVYGLLSIFFIIVGILAQLVTCFSRQNPYAHWMEDPRDSNDSNNSDIPCCILKCHIDKNFVTGYLFPDIIIVSLSLWVYLVEPIYNLIYNCDHNASLDKLIEQSNGVKNPRICFYTTISIIYIVGSFLLSLGYLCAFGFVEKGVAIKSEISVLSSNFNARIISIVFSLLGFIAFDLLYIHVILRYVYRCDLLIGYFKTTEAHFPRYQENDNERREGFTEDQQDDIETASKFLRKLNKSAFVTGMVIVVAGFTAFSCIVNLISTTDCPQDNKGWQILVVGLRLLLWLFIILFPFYKAAKVNEMSCELSVKFVTRSRDPKMVSKGVKYITSKARLIGIVIQPWLPNAFVLIIMFAIMLGSGINYFHLL